MPSLCYSRPGEATVHVDCPRDCGNEEVEVQFDENADVYTPERSCAACDQDAGTLRPFTLGERTELIDAARDFVRNFDPTDAQLRAAGMLAE